MARPSSMPEATPTEVAPAVPVPSPPPASVEPATNAELFRGVARGEIIDYWRSLDAEFLSDPGVAPARKTLVDFVALDPAGGAGDDFADAGVGAREVLTLVDCRGVLGRGVLKRVSPDEARVVAKPRLARAVDLSCGMGEALALRGLGARAKAPPPVDLALRQSLPEAALRWHEEYRDFYRLADDQPWFDAVADLDGDGGIDLVHVQGRCKLDDYTCGVFLQRVDTSWTPIGLSRPQ